jgi:hypothetical protein
MKITVPESIADISLQQFQLYDALLKKGLTDKETEKEKINIFTGIDIEQIDNIIDKDYKFILESIDKALEGAAPFTQTFEMQGVEFGLIPNFDKMTAGEYRDLTVYSKDIENMHKVMAVLFRPVIKRDAFNNYKIEKYKGTAKRCEVMKYMPMSIVNGALVFFSSLANELINFTQMYIQEEQPKAKPL